MKIKNHIKLLGIFFLIILLNGCEYQKLKKSNFIYKHTYHGLINIEPNQDLYGKNIKEIEEIFGPSYLDSYRRKNCKYYCSSYVFHPYFKTDANPKYKSYMICFDNKSNVKSFQFISNKEIEINKRKFSKSLQNHKKESKREIFKKIIDSSNFQVK